MGTPFKVGSSFSSYSQMKLEQEIYGGLLGTSFDKHNKNRESMYYSKQYNSRPAEAECACEGTNAYFTYKNYYNGDYSGRTIFSTAYKPENPCQNIDARDIPFTQIYDNDIDDATGKEYFMKAEDKNGNGIIDEDEITYYDNENDYNEARKKDGLFYGNKDNLFHWPMNW